jgi:TonB-linked SusC/RagA family outer membrane protein
MQIKIYSQKRRINPGHRHIARVFYLIALLTFLSMASFAQNITVRGHVVDDKGEPLIGASVKSNANAANGTLTDISGNFAISVGSNAVLTISYIGYVTSEVPIKGTTTNLGQIILAKNVNSLTDVVVVGYGVQRKSDVTGSQVTIDAKSLEETPATNVVQQLEGKVPGLDIIQNGNGLGATPAIRLRGNRTIGQGVTSGADNPLLVVDGTPYFGSLNDINPSDIKTLDILKDAAATAIYGSRGSGGVILITTNRGRIGRIVTTFDAYYGVSSNINELKVYNASQYAQAHADAAATQPLQSTPASLFYPLAPLEQDGITNGVNTDWQKLVLKNGFVADQVLGVSGGTESVQYHVSAGYRNETGIDPGTSLKRYNLTSNIDLQVSKHLKVGFNMINTLLYNNNGAGSQFAYAATLSPLVSPYNADGSVRQFPNVGQIDALNLSPLWMQSNPQLYYNQSHRIQNFATVYAEVGIIEGLKYRFQLSGTWIQGEGGSYNGVNGSDIPNQTLTRASTNNNENSRYNAQNLLTYDKFFGPKHHLVFTGLFEYEKFSTDNSSISVTNVPTDANINNALGLSTVSGVSSGASEYALISEMARGVYSYNNRYSLSATVRNDANSTLAAGHQTLAYPAVGLAWNVINEDFMKKYNWLDNLKLRLNYGITSNGALVGSPYQTLAQLSSAKYEYGSIPTGNQAGYLVGTLENPDLSWQKTAQWNLGVDFSVLKNKITGSIDVYSEKTTGILLNNVLPPSTGATGQQSNLGTSAGKGLEISVSSINISGKNGFTWSTDANIAFSRERIVELPNGILANVNLGEFVGSPLNVIYDVKKIGIFQINDPALAKQTSPVEYPGQIRVQDLNGDGIINSADNQILGSFQPQYTFGLTNRISYKNFDLSIVVNGRMGQTVLVPFLASNGTTGGFGFLTNLRKNEPYRDYWSPSNQAGTVTAVNSQIQRPLFSSTEQYYDGSWIRARSINVGYTFSQKLLHGTGLSSLRIYANCLNPFIIYAPVRKVADGMDPESTGNASSGVTNQTNGINTAPRPQTIDIRTTLRTFNFGLNVRF